jgi:hypothetical protein
MKAVALEKVMAMAKNVRILKEKVAQKIDRAEALEMGNENHLVIKKSLINRILQNYQNQNA